MIAQILELIKSLGSAALPWIIIDQWQGGIILRLGIPHRVLTPGFHWKWPFIESPATQNVVVTTTVLSAQSIIAPDGKVYTAEGVVRWRIDDVKPYICDVWDSANVIIDSAKSSIAETIRGEGIDEISNKVTKKSRNTLKKYGIYVEEITITTLAPIKCIRLIGSRIMEDTPTE